MRGNIILLNGVSSSGKSTLAAELVRRLSGYFCLGIDDFDLVIERMEDRPNKRLIPVETEYFFHRNVAMFSDRGVNLIVDHVLHDRFTTVDCLAALRDYPVLLVGVHCPPAVLDRREQERGDRQIGLGRQQLEYVHKGIVYDVEVDTAAESMDSRVARILDVLNGGGFPAGWRETSAAVHARV